eukprot:1123319-Rhodomonas_salina.2
MTRSQLALMLCPHIPNQRQYAARVVQLVPGQRALAFHFAAHTPSQLEARSSTRTRADRTNHWHVSFARSPALCPRPQSRGMTLT